MSARKQTLGRIHAAGRLVELRMRLARLLASAPFVTVPALGGASAALAAHKLGWLNEALATKTLATIGGAAAAALLASALRRLPPRAGTLALDRTRGLAGRLTNALEFDALGPQERNPLAEAAIDDACSLVEARREVLAASPASPVRTPRALGLALVPALALFALTRLEVRTLRPEPPAPATIDALVLTDDDLDLLRDAERELRRDGQSDEVKAALDRFNRLVEDLAARKLERTEAFRQLDAIERELLAGAEADKARLDEELRKTAAELDRSELARDLAKALKSADPKQAEDAMRELAKKLREKKKLDPRELERLREALARASELRKEALAAVEEKRAELEEQLLKKKQKLDAMKPEERREEERLLRKKERELERLSREEEAQRRANRELERLDRELAQAAQDLLRDLGVTQEDLQKAAQDLEEAAQDLNRMQQESQSQRDKEALKKRLEELREILNQQKQGGKQRMSRMIRFGKRARGGKGGGAGEPGGDGPEGEESGQGKPGGREGKGPGEGEGEGKGQGQGRGRGKGGEGQGEGEGAIELTLGPGGAPIPIPGGGAGAGDRAGGEGAGQGGKDWGSGHGGPIAGDKTSGKFGTQNVEQQGLEAGQGPSNSQVILSAAERGFRGADYENVFRQYRTVAEESLSKEAIPDGYRFYVQRYFQLIRPRD
jgi:hypothetical protein